MVEGIDGIRKREYEIKDISRTPLITTGNFAIIAGLGNVIFGISSILVGFRFSLLNIIFLQGIFSLASLLQEASSILKKIRSKY